VLVVFSLSIAIQYKICYGEMANIRGFPLMRKLISSLATASLFLFPTTSFAQHRFGGDFYQQEVQQQQARDYLELRFRDGRRVVTYPRSHIDRHEDVAAQYGIPHCEQRWREITPPSGFGYAAVITQGFCSNQQQPNHYNQNFNPGYSHTPRYGHNQPWNGGSGGGCLFKQWNKNSGFQVGNC